MLAVTAQGPSRLVGLPASLDVRSTAVCLAALSPKARPALDMWARNVRPPVEDGGSTWNERRVDLSEPLLEVEGDGRTGLSEPVRTLDCGNSGTSMRLLAGIVAAAPFRTVLEGDASLSSRPMERVAAPLRRMGARIGTDEGHAPLTIDGGGLRGIRFDAPVPSAQVKSAVLFAGVAAEGRTTVAETTPTRDHTERALAALGGPVSRDEGIVVSAFQHEGFAGAVPGDPSSAAFMIAAAALTGSSVEVVGVGLNPTRLHFLAVLDRMGVRTSISIEREELGEPVGTIVVLPGTTLTPVRVEEQELPLVIDEVPVLALVAAHAPGDSWFLGTRELRVKESDRVRAVVDGIRGLGGAAGEEGDDLVVAGGGLEGGEADARGDHRMAMGLTVAALAARRPCAIHGVEAADVSFPGFVAALRALGAAVESRS
jgi:3-phosphoshikimate 1-carboxyvinyltransferase